MTTTEQLLARQQAIQQALLELEAKMTPKGFPQDALLARVAELGHPGPIGELELVLEVERSNDKENFLERIALLPARRLSRP